MSENWTTNNIPNLAGRVAIVTGSNSGIGFETAKAMAEKGATVVMACRNLEKANAAADQIRQAVKDAELDIIQLDLADLASVRKFADDFQAKYDRLDWLINNAGIMIPPFTKTADGFEVQFGANHLGHFALTGHLLETILKTSEARIVNVSSTAHSRGQIDFENLNAEKGYSPGAAYSQSKLANLLFTLELNRHLREANSSVMATAAHPGWTVTGLQRGFVHLLSRLFGQSPPMGALPTLRAAIDPDAKPDDYYGPAGRMEMRGYPVKVESISAAKDPQLAKRLWQVSEELTDIEYLSSTEQ